MPRSYLASPILATKWAKMQLRIQLSSAGETDPNYLFLIRRNFDHCIFFQLKNLEKRA